MVIQVERGYKRLIMFDIACNSCCPEVPWGNGRPGTLYELVSPLMRTLTSTQKQLQSIQILAQQRRSIKAFLQMERRPTGSAVCSAVHSQFLAPGPQWPNPAER